MTRMIDILEDYCLYRNYGEAGPGAILLGVGNMGRLLSWSAMNRCCSVSADAQAGQQTAALPCFLAPQEPSIAAPSLPCLRPFPALAGYCRIDGNTSGEDRESQIDDYNKVRTGAGGWERTLAHNWVLGRSAICALAGMVAGIGLAPPVVVVGRTDNGMTQHLVHSSNVCPT